MNRVPTILKTTGTLRSGIGRAGLDPVWFGGWGLAGALLGLVGTLCRQGLEHSLWLLGEHRQQHPCWAMRLAITALPVAQSAYADAKRCGEFCLGHTDLCANGLHVNWVKVRNAGAMLFTGCMSGQGLSNSKVEFAGVKIVAIALCIQGQRSDEDDVDWSECLYVSSPTSGLASCFLPHNLSNTN